jgi:phospholipase C
VSWIDPAFTNFNPLGFPVNDDHPPADIKDGQDLVLAVYDALAASPQWHRSLLVIVYDENGGFYDHVPPPQAADDEPEMFGRYGVRVPAIIVSPWVEPRSVSSTLFDHTSIIKTILQRFCPKALNGPQQAGKRQPGPGLGPQYPGLRVAQANHLGELLTRSTPRPAPSLDALLQQAAARAAQAKTSQPRTDPGGQDSHPHNDLQKSVLAATHELTRRGTHRTRRRLIRQSAKKTRSIADHLISLDGRHAGSVVSNGPGRAPGWQAAQRSPVRFRHCPATVKPSGEG